jgi:hypothetical protein
MILRSYKGATYYVYDATAPESRNNRLLALKPEIWLRRCSLRKFAQNRQVAFGLALRAELKEQF